MALHYFKRYRMEIDLATTVIPQALLPKGYRWVTWMPTLVDRHASVKHQSFRAEVDAHVFPCLGDYYGCLRLMQDISRQQTFLPDATWLICTTPPEAYTIVPEGEPPVVDCGTIQGLLPSVRQGAIQNVGVAPEHRSLGLGRALVLQALWGFRQHGAARVTLEVTATNEPAVDLYRSIGFRILRTMYRTVDEGASIIPI